MHCLCASMRSAQPSSPFSPMQASRAFLVSGQAQHGLHWGFASAASGAAAATTASTGAASVDILTQIFSAETGERKFKALLFLKKKL